MYVELLCKGCSQKAKFLKTLLNYTVANKLVSLFNHGSEGEGLHGEEKAFRGDEVHQKLKV